MIPIQPQPAGLPSGSFGGRRRAAYRAPWRVALLATPHRLPFLLGSLGLVLTALWWGALLLARAAGVALLPWTVAPSLAHGLLLGLGLPAFFAAGALWLLLPRWLGQPVLPAGAMRLPMAMMGAGWLAVAVGAQAARPLAALGLATAAVGLALVVGLAGLLLVDNPAAPERGHARLALLAGGLTVLCQWAAAVLLALGRDAGVRAALMAGLWAGPALWAVVLVHRLLPVLAGCGDDGQHDSATRAWRPRAVLALLVGLVLVQAPLAALEAAAGGALPPLLAGARAAIELPGGALLLWLALRWGLVAGRGGPGLPMLLHTALAWLGVALTLGGVSHALMAASDGLYSLALAPLHAFTMGFLGTALLGLATAIARGEAGRPLQADRWTLAVFAALQVAVVARVLAELWPGLGWPFTLLAAQFWLAAVAGWALRHSRWWLRT